MLNWWILSGMRCLVATCGIFWYAQDMPKDGNAQMSRMAQLSDFWGRNQIRHQRKVYRKVYSKLVLQAQILGSGASYPGYTSPGRQAWERRSKFPLPLHSKLRLAWFPCRRLAAAHHPPPVWPLPAPSTLYNSATLYFVQVSHTLQSIIGWDFYFFGQNNILHAALSVGLHIASVYFEKIQSGSCALTL